MLGLRVPWELSIVLMPRLQRDEIRVSEDETLASISSMRSSQEMAGSGEDPWERSGTSPCQHRAWGLVFTWHQYLCHLHHWVCHMAITVGEVGEQISKVPLSSKTQEFK